MGYWILKISIRINNPYTYWFNMYQINRATNCYKQIIVFILFCFYIMNSIMYKVYIKAISYTLSYTISYTIKPILKQSRYYFNFMLLNISYYSWNEICSNLL